MSNYIVWHLVTVPILAVSLRVYSVEVSVTVFSVAVSVIVRSVAVSDNR
jgi:hypothetical protein